MSIFDRFSNQFGSLFGQGTFGQSRYGQGRYGKGGVKTGLDQTRQPQTMAEWKTLVDGMTRHERDKVWPGMHKDLIPATEIIDAMNRPAAPQAGHGTSQSPGYPGGTGTLPTSQKTGFGIIKPPPLLSPSDQVAGQKLPQTMAEWKTLVDGMTRHERDKLWPGMHKDLIPATEMIEAGAGGIFTPRAPEGGLASRTNSQSRYTDEKSIAKEGGYTPDPGWETVRFSEEKGRIWSHSIPIEKPQTVFLKTSNVDPQLQYTIEPHTPLPRRHDLKSLGKKLLTGNDKLDPIPAHPRSPEVADRLEVWIVAENGPLEGNLDWKFLPATEEVEGPERDEIADPDPMASSGPVGLPGARYNDMIATPQGDPWPKGKTWGRELDIGVPVLFTVETIFPDPSIGKAFLDTKYRFEVIYPNTYTGKEETKSKDVATGPQAIHVDAAPLPGEKTSTITVEITPISGPLKARLTRFLI